MKTLESKHQDLLSFSKIVASRFFNGDLRIRGDFERI